MIAFTLFPKSKVSLSYAPPKFSATDENDMDIDVYEADDDRLIAGRSLLLMLTCNLFLSVANIVLKFISSTAVMNLLFVKRNFLWLSPLNG